LGKRKSSGEERTMSQVGQNFASNRAWAKHQWERKRKKDAKSQGESGIFTTQGRIKVGYFERFLGN